MEKEIKKQNENKEVKKEIENDLKVNNQFISLKDLKKEDLKDFIQLPVILEKGRTNKGKTTYSIKVNIDSTFMPELNIRPNGDYLTADIFNELLLNIDAPTKDARGYDQRIWRYNTYARFVKGQYTLQNGEYYSLELLFKNGVYFTHFFDLHQTNILNGLIKKGIFKYKFFERPEKINKIDQGDEIDFE